MKFLAVFLSVCILLLSTAGIVKPVETGAKKMCCHRMANMSAAQMKKMQQQHNHKGCEKQDCTMLLSCPLCCFIIVEPLQFQPHYAAYAEKPVSLYKIGDLSAYHPSDWKPPKAC
jgi:hypothetical protein